MSTQTLFELVYDLQYVSFRTQRNLGSSYQSCAHPLAFGAEAVAFEERYQAEQSQAEHCEHGVDADQCWYCSNPDPERVEKCTYCPRMATVITASEMPLCDEHVEWR